MGVPVENSDLEVGIYHFKLNSTVAATFKPSLQSKVFNPSFSGGNVHVIT